MRLNNFARSGIVQLSPDASVSQAAQLMKEKNVGSIVITEGKTAVGIITDRDIVVRAVSKGLDPDDTEIKAVMTPDPITLDENLDLFEALETMKKYPVRRFLTTDADNNLSGFFSLDDVMYFLGIEMSAVSRIIAQESL